MLLISEGNILDYNFTAKVEQDFDETGMSTGRDDAGNLNFIQ
jgi:hypothetical protein